MGHSVQHQLIATKCFPFLLYAKQVGDVLQLILSQLRCILVCLLTVSAQTKRRTSMETYIVSCLVLMLLQQHCLQNVRELLASETDAPLTKEVICWHLFTSTKTHFKTFLAEREPNLKAFSFLEAALPNGQLRLLCINGDSI